MIHNPEAEERTPGHLGSHVPAGNDREPSTRSEKYLARLWCEIVGLERVALTDKFLDVGGNSLTLNVILNKIEKETGASLRPKFFFDPDRSSLAQLARELDALLAEKADRPQ